MITVIDYDPAWPMVYEELRANIWAVVGEFASRIEHIGSTSIPGLAAKPIIDMSVVVTEPGDVEKAIKALAKLGYAHQGNLGVEGREAFSCPESLPKHHLYVCQEVSLALRNHLIFRDHLLSHPEQALAYGKLKQQLAAEFSHDIDAYIDGKTDFIAGILRSAGIGEPKVTSISEANRKT